MRKVSQHPLEVAAADALPWNGLFSGAVRPMGVDSISRAYLVIAAMEIGTAVMSWILIPAIPRVPAGNRLWLNLDVGGIFLTGVVCFVVPIVMPPRMLRRSAPLILGYGAPTQPLFVTAGLLLGGGGADPLAVLYPMSLTFGFYLLRPWIALIAAISAPAQFALVVFLQPGHSDPALKLIICAIAVFGTSGAVGWIAGRADHLRLEADEARRELATLNVELEERVAEQVEQIRESRARIVEASDESRRRIERNIHDGAQQQLVAISLDLRMLAEGTAVLSPDELRSQLDETHANLKAALDDLRELARGLHPAVLSTDGLEAALGHLAARVPLPVSLAAPADRFAEHLETAAYFVAAEAVANAVKYADASAIAIGVERTDDALEISIADDGCGGASTTPGGGLAGLTDRVAALGGSLDIVSPAGAGTTVRVSIPIQDGDANRVLTPSRMRARAATFGDARVTRLVRRSREGGEQP